MKMTPVCVVVALLVLLVLPTWATQRTRNDTAMSSNSPPAVSMTAATATSNLNLSDSYAIDISTTATVSATYGAAYVGFDTPNSTGPPAFGIGGNMVNTGDTYNHLATINAKNGTATDGHSIYATARSGVLAEPALRAGNLDTRLNLDAAPATSPPIGRTMGSASNGGTNGNVWAKAAAIGTTVSIVTADIDVIGTNLERRHRANQV